jgi:transformation/transcription domain-associated protein
VVSAQLEKTHDLPLWVWFLWIPQLLISLSREEAPVVKLILMQLASTYPQLLYYGLRNYLIGMRELAQKAMSEQARLKRLHGPALEAGHEEALAGGGGHQAPGMDIPVKPEGEGEHMRT